MKLCCLVVLKEQPAVHGFARPAGVRCPFPQCVDAVLTPWRDWVLTTATPWRSAGGIGVFNGHFPSKHA